MQLEIILVIIGGLLGALIKDILEDNKLVLPKIQNGALCLGFIGSATIGACTGYLVDGSMLTAFMAGYTGSSLIKKILSGETKPVNEEKKNKGQIIREIAGLFEVDPDLAVRVAKCESSLDMNALRVNQSGSRDRGLFQINDKYHPDVTDEQAFDPEFSARFFCQSVKAGHLDWWNSSKSCWEKNA